VQGLYFLHPQKKLPDRKQFDYVTIDDTPMRQTARGNGKPITEMIRVLDDIEMRLLEQCPYPYADIAMVRNLRKRIMGEW
jgi:hypothetical protein